MKKIILIPIIVTLIMISQYLSAQNNRVLTFNSYCYQISYLPDTNIYHFWYTPCDSSITIQGLIAIENCGTQHILTVNIDSCQIHITEQIIDTAILTCTCDIRVDMNIDSFYCNDFTIDFQGDLILSVPNNLIDLSTSCQIVPNPSSDYFTLNSSNKANDTEIRIYDILGNLLLKYTIKNNQERIDISNLNKGIYFVQIGNLSNSMKLIKE